MHAKRVARHGSTDQKVMRGVPLPERLDARLDKTGDCWLWTGSKDGSGYGLIGVATSRAKRTHIVAWELANGPVPDGMCICHHCDTPACCNPAHLFLGSKAVNNRDRADKGRSADTHGENHPRARLDDDRVRHIRRRHQQGATLKEIAAEVGVSHYAVHDVVRGRTWSHVT